jgi:fermentation-respiration switch protein FrsA (DUF1100 family)
MSFPNSFLLLSKNNFYFFLNQYKDFCLVCKIHYKKKLMSANLKLFIYFFLYLNLFRDINSLYEPNPLGSILSKFDSYSISSLVSNCLIIL